MNQKPNGPIPRQAISVSTEITETTDGTQAAGTLYFDGTCAFCLQWINRFRNVLTRRGIRLQPFADGANEPEMRVLWHDGREFGGADAAIFLTSKIWWAWPVRILAILPGIRPSFRKIYRHVAATRHCRGGACSLEQASSTPPAAHAGQARCENSADPRLGWIVLVVLTGLVWFAGWAIRAGQGENGDLTLSNEPLPAWLWMWLLAGALWIGFKLIAWLRAGGWPVLGARTLLFAAWAGMDAASFVEKRDRRAIPAAGAVVRFAAGVLLIWVIIPQIEAPVLRGWLGMAGILLVLHFGLFEIAAAGWNRRGFQVRPIMISPWRARSLADFWGERWNRAFSDVTRASIFRPLVRRFGVPAGTLAGFAFSGLAHELVISVPAGGGYGLPTAYFLLQGAGVLAERKFGFRNTATGRAILWLVVLGPAFWLFHPLFMTGVINPFLEILELTTR